MFRASTAHHQEVKCVYVAKGTSKMTVSSLTVILKEFNKLRINSASSWLLYTYQVS
jgi:F0F1-type ATP synthase alpha subunit